MSNLKAKRREAGFTVAQIIITLLIVALFVGSVIANLGPQITNTRLNSAFDEIYNITSQIRRVRTYWGNYSPLTSFQFLTLRGYLEGYTTGLYENEFGLSMATLQAPLLGGVYFSYQVPTFSQCANLQDRVLRLSSKKQLPTCLGLAPSTLTVLVD